MGPLWLNISSKHITNGENDKEKIAKILEPDGA